jgi:hypothetical protein
VAGADDRNGHPGPARAARVRRTGIALVHRGEVILPAAGSEAQAETAMDDARTTVQYLFPVEIEVRVGGEAMDIDDLVEHAMNRLAIRLENG